MENSQLSDLYWQGGPFRVALRCEFAQRSAVQAAIAKIEEFRTACQKQYVAFEGTATGRPLAYERWKGLMDPDSADKTLFIGAGFPDTPQLPGRSVVAAIRQGEYLASLKKGGEFEKQHGKALVVFLYHLWEEQYRKEIADVLSVEKDQVECTLMGEIRRVRNNIIHENSIVPTDFVRRYDLRILPQIWHLHPGELGITQTMIHSMMEQINALRVDVISTVD